MKFIVQYFYLVTLAACSTIAADRHLNERTFKTADIKVKWYQVSEITSVHDFVDIERRSQTKTIMKANTDGIHDILIKGDTITIQTIPGLLVYDLTAKALDCHIRLDSTITICEYLKKHVPGNAIYYCDEIIADSIQTNKQVH